MKKYNLFFIFLTFSFPMLAMEPPTQEQVVRETYEQLALIRAELGKPPTITGQGQAIQNGAPAPNQQNIDAKKQRLQGAHFDRLSSAILAACGNVRMQRITQEAIAHVAIATSAAHESALEEKFIQKNVNLTQGRSQREAKEEELGILHEIKNLQENRKQEAKVLEKITKDLNFLHEIKNIDEKLSHVFNRLCQQDIQLTSEIMSAQQSLNELKLHH